ncbi:UNKNOWN [Stylonychia lemnae]|uniref:Potassium channel domain-containing protein n=1 Tax=Stylonychia lemnae TaxID=5949 RepID=A0A078B065_STYLE|nr:UNKNOWN [Stylonychia lemnae]|eukprot:CDW88060.1 UNKNOWN [Stylonychia lemnae]
MSQLAIQHKIQRVNHLELEFKAIQKYTKIIQIHEVRSMFAGGALIVQEGGQEYCSIKTKFNSISERKKQLIDGLDDDGSSSKRLKRFLNFFKFLNKLAANIFTYNNHHKIAVQKAIRENQYENSKSGWLYEHNEYNVSFQSIYIKSLYFILTSFATIGYGDYSAGLNSRQALFVICYMMFLQQMFSFFQMQFRAQFTNVDIISSPMQLLDDKKGELELLFMKISKIESVGKFQRNIVKQAVLDIELSFKYFFKSVKSEAFYILLPPRLKRKLILEIGKPYIYRFIHFFEDEDKGYYADDQYIKIFNKYLQLLVQYVSGGFFGECEIIFKIRSNYILRVSENQPAILLCLKSTKLMQLIKSEKPSLLYLAQVGYERRCYLRDLSQKVDGIEESSRKTQRSNLLFSEIVAVAADQLRAGEIIKLYANFLQMLQSQKVQKEKQYRFDSIQMINDQIIEESVEESKESSSSNSELSVQDSSDEVNKINSESNYQEYNTEEIEDDIHDLDYMSVEEVDHQCIDIQRVQFNKYVQLAQNTLHNLNELVDVAKQKFIHCNQNFKSLDELSLKFARFNHIVEAKPVMSDNMSNSQVSMFNKLRIGTMSQFSSQVYQSSRQKTKLIKLQDAKQKRGKYKKTNFKTQDVCLSKDSDITLVDKVEFNSPGQMKSYRPTQEDEQKLEIEDLIYENEQKTNSNNQLIIDGFELEEESSKQSYGSLMLSSQANSKE